MENKGLYSEILKLLARKSYSEEEVMERIGVDIASPAAKVIVNDLRTKGYLDDNRLAESIVEKLIEKGKGYHYILSELSRRKIKKDVIEKIENSFDYERELASAQKFWKENIKKKKPSAVFTSLMRRGFSSLTMEKIAGYCDTIYTANDSNEEKLKIWKVIK